MADPSTLRPEISDAVPAKGDPGREDHLAETGEVARRRR